MLRLSAALSAAVVLSACGAPPQTEAQKAANRSIGYEVLATRCTPYVGGFDNVQDIQARAASERQDALQLGATQQDFANGRQLIGSTMTFGNGMIGSADTCGALMSSLAKFQ